MAPRIETISDTGSRDRWLFLIHQIPAKPAYLRVKIWRRLQALGAVAVKNAVYALPASDQAQEDFEWVLKEICEGGGEAMICEARLIDGLSDHEVRALFNAAREEDYDLLVKDARMLADTLRHDPTLSAKAEAKAQLAKLKARAEQILAIDFFGANGREPLDGLLAGLEDALKEDDTGAPKPADASPGPLHDASGRVWVTRKGVYIDRIASAWLIRKFIDPAAQFKFVPGRGYGPEANELRFDMFDAEFTHVGDRCTFEVLLASAGFEDPALEAIAEIVHDIDLKDEKFGRQEVGGIKTLISGLVMAHKDDAERIAHGAAILDDLYEFFRKMNRMKR
jgi:hypothetical protein